MRRLQGLTEQQLDRRKGFMNASSLPIIMGGGERAYDFWLVETGQKDREDLSAVLPVQMGIQTEPLNLDWFEMATGLTVTDEGREIERDFMRCTLDGMAGDAVVECKHVNAFSKMDEVQAHYAPQLAAQMDLVGASVGYLSVIKGTQEHHVITVERDLAYSMEVFAAAQEFWAHIQNKTEPPCAPVAPPAPPSEFKPYDMTGNNEWSVYAGEWSDNQAASKLFKAAEKNLKTLVPDDASIASGHGVQIKRAKNGALRIGEQK